MKKLLLLVLIHSGLVSTLSAIPFELSDSDPNNPQFRKNYMGIYGVNSAIEPRLAETDRLLYDAVLPHLKSDPEQAILLLVEGMLPECNAAFNFLLGSLYFSIEKDSEAEAQLLLSIEKHPSFRRAHRTVALVYARRNNVDKVMKHIVKVVELGGGDAQSYGMLGYGYLLQEKYRSSLVAYQNARMFAPDSYDFKRGEAQCLLMTQQYGQAIALYDELIAENPDEADFWLLQSNALLALDDRDRTAANLEMVRSLGNGNFNNLILLASLYLEDQAYSLGVEIASEALVYAESNDFVSAMQLLEFMTQRDLMDYAKGYRDVFEKELLPKVDLEESNRFEVAAASVDFALGDCEEGVDRLKAIIQQDPLEGRSLILLGRYFLDVADVETAEFYFECALSAEAFKAEAHVALGQLAVSRGEFKVALDELRKAQLIEYRTTVQDYLDQVAEAVEHAG